MHTATHDPLVTLMKEFHFQQKKNYFIFVFKLKLDSHSLDHKL